MVEHREHRPRGSRFRIFCAIRQFTEPRVNHRAGTHRAGFERDVEFAIGEAIVVERSRGSTQRDNLCVRGGIHIAQHTILTAGQNTTFIDENGADRHFASLCSECGLFKGEAQKAFLKGVVHVHRIRYRDASHRSGLGVRQRADGCC